MKNFKKILACVMAISTISTMGVSTIVSAEETQKTFYTGDVNLDGKVNTIDLLTLKKMLLGLADMQKMYIDNDTLKLVEDNKEETINTINTMENSFIMNNKEYEYQGFVIDLEESCIKIQVDTVDGSSLPVYLMLKVTDNTVFNSQVNTLEQLKELNYPYYEFKFNDNQELVSINQLEISSAQTTAYDSDNYNFYFNPTSNIMDIVTNSSGCISSYTRVVTIDDSTKITLDGIDTTLENIAKTQPNSHISVDVKYDVTSHNYIATNIVAKSINQDIKSISIDISNTSNEIFGINTEMGTISISHDNNNQVDLFYTNDDTKYSGIVSSIEDLSTYQSCYVSVVLTPEGNQSDVKDVIIYYTWNIDYYTNTDGKNIITNITVYALD